MPFACRVRLCRRRRRASRQVCCSLPPPACPLLPRLPPGMWMDSPGPADVFPFRGRRADSPEHPIVSLSRNRRVGVLGDFLSGVSPPPLFRQAYPLPYARRRTLICLAFPRPHRHAMRGNEKRGSRKLPRFLFFISRDFLSGLLAVRRGLEPLTPCVTGTYSNQLN